MPGHTRLIRSGSSLKLSYFKGGGAARISQFFTSYTPRHIPPGSQPRRERLIVFRPIPNFPFRTSCQNMPEIYEGWTLEGGWWTEFVRVWFPWVVPFFKGLLCFGTLPVDAGLGWWRCMFWRFRQLLINIDRICWVWVAVGGNYWKWKG